MALLTKYKEQFWIKVLILHKFIEHCHGIQNQGNFKY